MRNGKNKNLFGDFESLFNDLNSIFGGFTPMSFNGNSNTEEGIDENGKWAKQTFMSDDGSIYMTSFYRTGGNDTPNKLNKIDLLKMNLNDAIENEDFERAITIRDKIKKYEENGEKIAEMEKKLAKAIKSHNFEEAIKLRDELKEIKISE